MFKITAMLHVVSVALFKAMASLLAEPSKVNAVSYKIMVMLHAAMAA